MAKVEAAQDPTTAKEGLIVGEIAPTTVKGGITEVVKGLLTEKIVKEGSAVEANVPITAREALIAAESAPIVVREATAPTIERVVKDLITVKEAIDPTTVREATVPTIATLSGKEETVPIIVREATVPITAREASIAEATAHTRAREATDLSIVTSTGKRETDPSVGTPVAKESIVLTIVISTDRTDLTTEIRNVRLIVRNPPSKTTTGGMRTVAVRPSTDPDR